MCFDPNARIAAVRPSDYGYDVKLNDGTVGNVANNAKDPYYDEVQSYLARTTPSSDPLAGQPSPQKNLPVSGQVGFNQVGDGQNGVTRITDTDVGGRYGLGTRNTTTREGGNTVDEAPPTAGNIAQVAANALGIGMGGLGMAGTIGSMLGQQGASLGGGTVAKTVDGALKGPAPAKPAAAQQAKGGGERAAAEARSHAQAEANARASAAKGNPHTRGGKNGGGNGGGGSSGRGSDAGMGRGTGAGKY